MVWLLEHDPVYTTGRHGRREDLFIDQTALAGLGASFHAIDRGGQMTWHGPGQTTGYVIADLRPHRRLREFVDALVEGMRLASGIPGARGDRSALGLYVDGRKLGSVGVRVSGGVTTHGLALNRDPDMLWFERMTACAAPDVQATSIAGEGGDADRERVERALAAGLAEHLDLSLADAELDELLGSARNR